MVSMALNDELPRSTKIFECGTDSYWITAARWESEFNDCYEIGIRSRKDTREFHLLQGNWRTESALKNAMECVRILLNGGMTPTEVRYFAAD